MKKLLLVPGSNTTAEWDEKLARSLTAQLTTVQGAKKILSSQEDGIIVYYLDPLDYDEMSRVNKKAKLVLLESI